MSNDFIVVKGARQNNLKDLNLRLPLNELIVVTGVSGSGKSSLAFDTIYAEGQRRYVETFSPYARQFLDRMDKPRADRIEGIPPAIAIDQINPVRTSRSTVGTMTELNDHIKLLFARTARVCCRGCGRSVQRDSPQSTFNDLIRNTGAEREPAIVITFPVTVPHNFTTEEVMAQLAKQGYTKIHRRRGTRLEVVQDRVRLSTGRRERIVEGLEAAFKYGQGHVCVYSSNQQGKTDVSWRFSSELHCPDCDIHYRDPVPSLFSFNSPLGACETCRGFGRTIGIDYDLVVPDVHKSLVEGAVRPWQSDSYRECQDDLMRFARRRGIPTDVPWRQLDSSQKRWVLAGEGDWEDDLWYGVRRFFDWLETKSYKMHIRVLLSKYRNYAPCQDCKGARLKSNALWWRLGTKADADRVLVGKERFKPAGLSVAAKKLASLPGLTIHDVMLLSIERCRDFFTHLHLPKPMDEATDLLLNEIRTRLNYLVEVGLGYLTLDRQSRSLSGGEVQRINLTTALGTSLVNTLFVLDEPSIGLHHRDVGRVINILKRLRNAGNSLLVVEHDPHIMLAADRILDLGPGPGERGGKVVFFGTPEEIMRSKRSRTARYLSGASTNAQKTEDSAKPIPARTDPHLEIFGAAEHNLKSIDIRIPLRRLVCVTGVSGSGKSTLVRDVMYLALRKLKGKPVETPGHHRRLRGHEHIDEVVMVDQSPIGKTTRSNPASYVGALDAIRKAFAAEPLARERGYTAGTFSFNSGLGRCPTCSGNGFEHVEMQFLSDVYLRCSDCDGRRYRPEVLEVKLLPQTVSGTTEKRKPCSSNATFTRAVHTAKSIADVLDMTVTEAIAFFVDYPDVMRGLRPLEAVGLDYLKLGQPVPTLSGGEAQRLKLAAHLVKRRKPRSGTAGNLFLFDEPTTGLHFDDIAKLMLAYRQLLDDGHSLIVIEHNLDVVGAADWIIDLGPEGGDGGGEVVCSGAPQEVARHTVSRTGAALRQYLAFSSATSKPAGTITARTSKKLSPATQAESNPNDAIRIHKAREHNLKNIDLQIPRNRFTVITGISGSGKSTVAFDILFAEGQRRYLESLNAYARQFVQPAARPDVDAIFGIPPTVAIEQRTSRGGYKSTVATTTEIYHFLRLLFVKLGNQFCPTCGMAIEAQTSAAIAARIANEYRGRRVSLLAPLVVARKGYYTDLAKWAAGKGFTLLRVDGESTSTAAWPRLDRFKEHDIELPMGDIEVTHETEATLRELLERTLDYGRGVAHLLCHETRAAQPDTPRRSRVGNKGLGQSKRQKGAPPSHAIFSTQRACPTCKRSFAALDPRLFSFNSKHGWCEQCNGTGLLMEESDGEEGANVLDEYAAREHTAPICPACNGKRLRPEALAVRFHDRTIDQVTTMTVAEAEGVFRSMRLNGRDAEIAHDILVELRSRLRFLKQVGLPYLTLDRPAPTLSGGEAQRIRLASQLGSNLQGVCYVLDEPTIGLHPRDNEQLLKTLQRLEKKGNTVVVVEHDEETIRRAAHVVDLGPGAGVNGGKVVAEGSLEELLKNPKSITGQFLSTPLQHPLNGQRERTSSVGGKKNHKATLKISGVSMNNLKDLQVRIPLQDFVCVTGVSGSGKSTLVREVLHENLRRLLSRGRKRGSKRSPELWGCRKLEGWETIRRVLEVDQTPIGKTPRSCPATYVGLWDTIRRLFADTPEARMRGYGPARFSFNLRGGRCDECDGQGFKKIEMNFLPDVKVPCDACGGARFSAETLTVRFKDKNIAEVLAMNVEEAVAFFRAHAALHHTLQLLQDVGLGYLTLGQHSPTLSGGEAQRIKLVTELAKTQPGKSEGPLPSKTTRRPIAKTHTVYILDEPTIGLHMADVEKLIRVLHRLVDAGNTVVVIEHNQDIIAEADWVIDLGPEGGDGGGRIVAQGTPQDIARVRKGSHTARFLARFLREHRPRRC